MTKAEAKTAKSEEKQRVKAEAKSAKSEEKQRVKADRAVEHTAKAKEKKMGRHFIVLPTGVGQVLGGGDKWDKVVIEGVKDEVAAHCGLFIRGQNLDYDGLVDRVGNKILAWCRTI
jgi:hypothetical protein